MRRNFLSFILVILSLWGALPVTANAAPVEHRYSRNYYARRHYARRRAHRKTVKRVGIGAAGGALVGALAGGGKGSGIGAAVGAGAGYLYDRHKKHEH